MRIYRAYVDADLFAGDELALSARAANHLVRVLRHRAGDHVTLFDGRGTEAAAEIVAAHRQHGCRVRILETAAVNRESGLTIELLPGLSRGEKMDWVIQKSVELGVAVIQPIITERCEVRPAHGSERRMARWREIIISACEQSGRARLPIIRAPLGLEKIQPTAPNRLALDPSADTGLADHEPSGKTIAIAVGPEGGFSPDDLAILDTQAFQRITIGPRVLRTETAGIAAISVLQALYGDLGKT